MGENHGDLSPPNQNNNQVVHGKPKEAGAREQLSTVEGSEEAPAGSVAKETTIETKISPQETERV
jgi:hypothetical protein